MQQRETTGLSALRAMGRVALWLLVVLIVSASGLIAYQYLMVMVRPAYDPDTMPLAYEMMGDESKDTKLLLIHGLLGSKTYWERDMDEISATHQILALDLLGFGDSPKPNSDYSLEVQLQAIEKLVAQQEFNHGKIIVVGHSMGAIIAMALVAKHPDWFEGAVLISLPVFRNEGEFSKLMEQHSVFDRLAAGPFSELVCMFQPLFTSTVFKPENMPKDIFEDVKKHTWQSYSNSLQRVVIGTNLSAIAASVNGKKTLFIHGEKDTSAPIESARQLATSLKGSKFITLPNEGHQLFLTNSKMVWNEMDEFNSELTKE